VKYFFDQIKSEVTFRQKGISFLFAFFGILFYTR